MATATTTKTDPKAAASAAKSDKPKKEPKALLVRLDEQITRSVISKKDHSRRDDEVRSSREQAQGTPRRVDEATTVERKAGSVRPFLFGRTEMALFNMGRLVATQAALKFCGDNQINILKLLLRHSNGDWGDITGHDRRSNKEAIINGSRIFSAYRFEKGIVWLITEAVGDDGTRASTCVLMPKDY